MIDSQLHPSSLPNQILQLRRLKALPLILQGSTYNNNVDSGDSVISTMKTFLDLPAEIRNIIYELVSDSVLENSHYGRHKHRQTGLTIKCYQRGYAHIPLLADVCRQIRIEFLSQGLPRYPVEVYERDFARSWDCHADEIFNTYLKNLSFKIYLPTYISKGIPSGDILYFHARYRDTLGAEAIMRFKCKFFLDNRVTLDEASRTAIRRTLSGLLLPGDVALTARNFVRAVERISRLRLCRNKAVSEAPSGQISGRARLDFSIVGSPRRLHEVESHLRLRPNRSWVEYSRNVVEAPAELLDEQVDE